MHPQMRDSLQTPYISIVVSPGCRHFGKDHRERNRSADNRLGGKGRRSAMPGMFGGLFGRVKCAFEFHVRDARASLPACQGTAVCARCRRPYGLEWAQISAHAWEKKAETPMFCRQTFVCGACGKKRTEPSHQ